MQGLEKEVGVSASRRARGAEVYENQSGAGV